MAFADALRKLNSMREEGVIQEYTIAGALAILFWTEPVLTYDLDVLVFLPKEKGPLVNKDVIYRWAEANGYPLEDEHVLVEGVPTQFVPCPNQVSREAIETAVAKDYEGVTVRVVVPEYLIALDLQPEERTHKRRERAAALRPRTRCGQGSRLSGAERMYDSLRWHAATKH